MKDILGIKYITRKEASFRYGLSISWFKQRQQKHEYPHFVKIGGKGRVFYDVIKTDEWFKNNMKETE